MRMLTIGLLALSVTMPAAAQVPTIPDCDPVAYCQRSMQAIGQGESRALLNSCLANEQSGYDALKARWAEFSEGARRQCGRNMTAIRATSYWLLLACINQEEAARMGQFQFRR